MSIVKYLLDKEIITTAQLNESRQKRQNKSSLIKSLIDLNFVEEDQIIDAFRKVCDVPYVDMDSVDPDPDLVQCIPGHLQRRYAVMPIGQPDLETLEVAMADPTDLVALDDLRALTSLRIRPVLARPRQLSAKIESFAGGVKVVDSVLKDVEQFSRKKINWDDEQINSQSAILNLDRSPIVQLVDTIILNGVREKASDIHIEPMAGHVEIRYRIDGHLAEKMQLPKNIQRHLVSRIKILAALDISECRRAQDGRIKKMIAGRKIDLRISILPTVFGEKIVFRILDTSDMKVSLDTIGIPSEERKILDEMFRQPQGMVLACGPTGSGKTTTLYAAINAIKSKEKNIVTIEDPVEYTIEGVNQTQVNDKIGLTFANGLRTILRQDPDCILVGEIRDSETANMAFRASLTGHLVFSTLHTNCAVSAITRLRDIGIEPFLIASSLLGVISQRLLRKVCPHCRSEYRPDEMVLKKFRKLSGLRFYRGDGCPSCRHTGYQGRMVVFELLVFTDEIRRLVNSQAPEEAIREKAREDGFRSILEKSLEHVVEGSTTLEEVIRVIGQKEGSDEDVCPEDLLGPCPPDFVFRNLEAILKAGPHGRV